MKDTNFERRQAWWIEHNSKPALIEINPTVYDWFGRWWDLIAFAAIVVACSILVFYTGAK